MSSALAYQQHKPFEILDSCISGPYDQKVISTGPAPYTHGSAGYIFGWLLICAQVLDGVLTYLGTSRFGLEAEGNPLLRFLMETFGSASALVMTKICAIFIVFFLMSMMSRLSWLRSTLGGLTVLYAIMAIIPWTILLSQTS